jgi:hypothetical protein
MPTVFSIIDAQKACAIRTQGSGYELVPYTVSGTSNIDGSSFTRTFPSWDMASQWMTTFEASQYTFV